MKKVVLIFATIFILSACADKQEVWTKDYEKDATTELYRSLHSTLKDDSQRKQLADFVIKRLKKELPEGLESISPASLQLLTFRIEKEYAYNKSQQVALPWTDINEESLRIELQGQYAQEITDAKKRDKFCNCVIEQLRARQPDSLWAPIADTTLASLTKTCNKR